MSPNGTLIAYSASTDMKNVRDRAALVSMAWKEHASTKDSDMRALTIETTSCNIIARSVQPALLLVIIGRTDARAAKQFYATPEFVGDDIYPHADYDNGLPPDSLLTGTPSTPNNLLLEVQRRKLEVLVKYVSKDLGSFVMPEDSQYSRPFP